LKITVDKRTMQKGQTDTEEKMARGVPCRTCGLTEQEHETGFNPSTHKHRYVPAEEAAASTHNTPLSRETADNTD
jgi:hypothetical protein